MSQQTEISLRTARASLELARWVRWLVIDQGGGPTVIEPGSAIDDDAKQILNELSPKDLNG